MYYVCNSSAPMDPPSVSVQMHAFQAKAFEEANDRAMKDPNGLSWYVHEFKSSTVVYRASSVVTLETEMLSGNSDPQ